MEAIVDYSVFLHEAKDAVTELDSLKQKRDQASLGLRQDKRALEAEKKAVADEIRKTSKKRLDDISSGYDKQIGKCQDRLRKAKSRREAAKGKGMRERIVEETADLRDDNRRIRLEITTLFQQWHIPAYCNTTFYYSLYYPKFAGEFVILALTVLVCFLVIPFGVYLLIPNRHVWQLVLAYVICILLFGGLYILVGGAPRDEHGDILRQGRQLRNERHANDRRIRAITRSIKKDQNDSVYNLGQYDDEISHIQHELSDIAQQKKDAVNTFETVTRNIIFDEITASHKERLDQLTDACEKREGELNGLEASLKEKSLAATERYAPYLGNEFMTAEKIDALLETLANGTAANLAEAIREYKRTHA